MSKQRPLLSGERVQLRLAGQKPVLVADAESLALVMDPSHLTASVPFGCNAATFTVRRGSQPLVGISSVSGDATASVLDVGGIAGGATYLSVRTAGTDGTSDASMRMTERLRVGPGNQVSLPEATELVAYGNASVHRDLTIYGGLYATRYLNLVDDYITPSITRPPTANALRTAFIALSNLIIGSGNNGSSMCGTTTSKEWFSVPAVSCVAVDSASYCNIVQDYLVSDARRPPSSAALAASYAQLSNYVALQIQQVRYEAQHETYSNLWMNGDSNSNSSSSTCVSVATDMWITGGSGSQRMWFPAEGTQHPTRFETPAAAAAAAAAAESAAFQWSASSNVLLTLSHGGGLAVEAGVTVGCNCEVGGGAAVGGSLRVGGSMEVGGCATLACLTVASPSNPVVLHGKLDARGGYSNLPLASADGQTVGMVRLQSPTLGGSDVALGDVPESTALSTAATIAGLWDVDRRAQVRDETMQGLLGNACYSAEVAKAMSIDTSNVVHAFVDAPTFFRSYDSNAIVKAVQVTNTSGDVHAGVSLDMTVGTNRGSLKLTHQDLSLSGPGPAQIVLGAAGGVDVRAAEGGFVYHVLPPSPSPSSTTMQDGSSSWHDAATMTTFTATASSIFDFPNAPWAMPIEAFDEDTESYWISDYARYATDTGYPLPSAASVDTLPALEGVRTIETILGEWIQLDVATPPSISGAYIGGFTLSIVNHNHVPDDFVLLGMDPRDSQWRILHDTVGQASRLREAGLAGCTYTVSPPWTHRQMRGFRLVITRVSTVHGVDSGIFSSFAQVGRLSFVNASLNQPVPERSFTVEGGDVLVVDRQGRVGCGIGRDYLPAAQLHIRLAPGARSIMPALRIDGGSNGNNAFEFWLGDSNALYLDLPTPDGSFAVRGGRKQVLFDVDAATGDVSASGGGRLGTVLYADQGVESGSNVVARSDVIATRGTLVSKGGAAVLSDASLGSESRVLERRRVDSRRLMPGIRFALDTVGRVRTGLVSDLGSLSAGTAGVVGIGGPGEEVSALRTPIALEWTGLFQSDPRGSSSNYVIAFSNAEAPASLRVGEATLWTFGALVGSNVEPPVQLAARGGADDLVLLLPDAETIVSIDLRDRFIDDQVDWMLGATANNYLTFELLGDPSGVVVNSNDDVWQARGMYRDIETALKIRATSVVTGLSLTADVAVRELGAPPPNLPRQLGYLDVPDDQAALPVDYDLGMYFEDATRPATGLEFQIESATSSVVPVGYAMLLIARSDQVVVEGGTSVTQWTPTGTSGTVFKSQLTHATPTYSASGGGQSGRLPYVSFTNSFLKNSGAFNVDIADGGGVTLLAHVRFPESQSDISRIFAGGVSLGVDKGGWIEFARESTKLVATSQQLDRAYIKGIGYAPLNQWCVIAMRFSNATKDFQVFHGSIDTVNTITMSPSTQYTTNIAFGDTVAIGCNQNGGENIRMDLNFMALYPRALSDDEMNTFFSATDAVAGAGAATIEGSSSSVLRITPDFRGRTSYDVVVRGTSVGYPGSTATNTLRVTEPWPVVGRQWFPKVTLVDNYTASTYTVDKMTYFADLADRGLVYTVECDVEGAVTLGGVPWGDVAKPALPESDVTPAFPGVSANFQTPSIEPMTLAITGDYRDRTFEVGLVATSIAYPYMSARRVISVTESRAPPPEPLVPSLGEVTLDWTRDVCVVDLSSMFMDMAMRGVSYTVEVDVTYGNAMIGGDGDGQALVVMGAYRNTMYDVRVYATSEPYGVRQETPLILKVIESSRPPTATSRPLGYVLLRVAASSDVPIRASMMDEFVAYGGSGSALSFEIVGPPTDPLLLDNVFVDPLTSELVVRGAMLVDTTYSVTVRAMDKYGQYVDVVFSIDNVAPPTLTSSSSLTLVHPGTWDVRSWFRTNDSSLRYTLVSCGCAADLDARAQLNPTSGVLTVYAGAVGGESMEVRATDTFGQSCSVTVVANSA